MPGGRPTKYDPKFCEEIILYFDRPAYTIKKKKVVTQKGIIEVEEEVCTDCPSFAGFSCYIDVCYDTLNEWRKIHPEFSESYKKAKKLQERWFLENGTKGLINTSFSIFAMKNVVGYRDKPEEKEEDAKDKWNLTTEQIQALVKAVKKDAV